MRQRLPDRCDRRAQANFLEQRRPCFAPEQQQAVAEGIDAVDAADHAICAARDGRRGVGQRRQHFGIGADRRQGRAQFVRQVGGKGLLARQGLLLPLAVAVERVGDGQQFAFHARFHQGCAARFADPCRQPLETAGQPTGQGVAGEQDDEGEQDAGAGGDQHQVAQAHLVVFDIVEQDVARAVVCADGDVKLAAVADDLVVANGQCADFERDSRGRRGAFGDPVELHVRRIGEGRFRRRLPYRHAVGDLLAEDFLDEFIFLFVEDHQHRHRLRQDGEQRQRGDAGGDAQTHAGRWPSGRRACSRGHGH